jgi:hypothetical protein
MLQTKQVLQGRYQLQQQLGNNAGRQTWLATDIKISPAEPVTVKLLAFSPQMKWDDFKLFEREASVLNTSTIPAFPNIAIIFPWTTDRCWVVLVWLSTRLYPRLLPATAIRPRQTVSEIQCVQSPPKY